jgi:hypothetical protein
MSASHRVLRAVMVLASLGLVVLPYAVGGGLHPVAAALVVLTVLAVRRPESLLVGGLLVAHAVHWTASAPVPDGFGPWLGVLGGGWLALLVHVCASAAATWPPAAPVPAAALLRWGRRTAAVGLVTVPVWGVAVLTRDQSLRGEVSMTFVAMAGLTVLGLALHVATGAAAASRGARAR